jgi:hypothetical protein
MMIEILRRSFSSAKTQRIFVRWVVSVRASKEGGRTGGQNDKWLPTAEVAGSRRYFIFYRFFVSPGYSGGNEVLLISNTVG